MGLLDSCKEFFDTDNLYEVLGVEKTANDSQLKKGYHKQSLKVHPDRVKKDDEREIATKKFQTLGKVYKVLTDKDLRAIYDESGEVDDDDDVVKKDRDWDEYWRILFKKVTIDDIKTFEKDYIGSQAELNDLKSAYLEGEGSMEFIIDNVLCCTYDDEDRFAKIIKGWIKKKEVPEFKAFTKESANAKKKRRMQADSEAQEAEEAKKALGLTNDENSLANLIMKRQADREKDADSFFDHLAAKYGNGSGSKKGRKKK